MGKYYDVISGLKLAFSRFTDRELLKWSVFQFIGNLVLGFVLGLSLAVLLVTLLPSALTVAGAPAPDPSFLVALILNAGAGIVFAFILLFAVWLVLVTLWSLYTTMFMARAAMGLCGIYTPPKPQRLLDLFVLDIRTALLSIGCWYDKKLLVPAAVALALAVIAGAVGVIMGNPSIESLAAPLGVLMVLLWALGAFVHAIRTTFACYLFFRGDGSEGGMPRKSYDLVAGQTLEVALAILAGSILVSAVIEVFKYVSVAAASIPLVGMAVGLLVSILVSVLSVSFLVAYLTDIFGFYAGPGSSGAHGAPAAASMPKTRPAPKAKPSKAKGKKR